MHILIPRATTEKYLEVIIQVKEQERNYNIYSQLKYNYLTQNRAEKEEQKN